MKISEDKLKYCPEPTIKFNVGDKVDIGHLKDAVIEEAIEDGKVYLIDYTKIYYNYGNPIEHVHQKGYWMWYEIYPKFENIDHNLIKNTDISLYYSQKTISSLLCNIYDFGTDTNPVYQRDYVWTEEDKVALIDSIFHGIDIGKFVFIHLPYTHEGFSYEILDGKQRLKAITDFYEGRISYKGLLYRDLSAKERCFFEDVNISYAELKEPTEEQKWKTFILINTKGKVMDEAWLTHVKDMYKEKTGEDIDAQ